MPELPEVEALTIGLADRMSGRRIERCQLASISALKTFDPPLEQAVGRTVAGAERRGKFVCIDLDGLWLVVHLARGGWVRWHETVPTGTVRPGGKSPIALRVALDDRSGFDLTEMGTEKRLAIWLVRSLEEVSPLAELGVDPLTPEFTVHRLAMLMKKASATVKSALTTQSLIAGVGNAYSDEALHRARLSPYKHTGKLNADEVARLHAAVVGVLREAVDRSAPLGIAELKGDKKRSMQVHGRTGQPCPVCGDTIRQVSFATKSLQYCPSCQTGGQPLADRRLSRLLK
ncbi:MAG TPA: DNA-formamidopyrimidine glycosylase family protein [Acidimicrobiales bacterium]|jgi:formamidopyrimidine-DNA glycosylase|nr:DNA-formamidopyrimidine glycosylase family protein [Acidimicrobiales bacterium]